VRVTGVLQMVGGMRNGSASRRRERV